MGRPRESPHPPVVAYLMQALECESLYDVAMRLGASISNVRNWDKGRPVPDRWLLVADDLVPGVIGRLRELNQTSAGAHVDAWPVGLSDDQRNQVARQRGVKPKESGDAPRVSHVREPSPRLLDPGHGSGAFALAAAEHLAAHSNEWVLPLQGDGLPLVTGALLAPQTASLARPLVLPVRIGPVQREFQVIPAMTKAALAGRVPAADRATRVEAATAELAGVMAFDRAWLREHLGRDGGGFVSVSVSGDSMEPVLSDGDSIIVDTLVDRVDASGIYVIRVGVDLLVKRVHRRLDGALVISSDNAKYPPDELPASRAGELRVVGRLVWPRLR